MGMAPPSSAPRSSARSPQVSGGNRWVVTVWSGSPDGGLDAVGSLVSDEKTRRCPAPSRVRDPSPRLNEVADCSDWRYRISASMASESAHAISVTARPSTISNRPLELTRYRPLNVLQCDRPLMRSPSRTRVGRVPMSVGMSPSGCVPLSRTHRPSMEPRLVVQAAASTTRTTKMPGVLILMSLVGRAPVGLRFPPSVPDRRSDADGEAQREMDAGGAAKHGDQAASFDTLEDPADRPDRHDAERHGDDGSPGHAVGDGEDRHEGERGHHEDSVEDPCPVGSEDHGEGLLSGGGIGVDVTEVVGAQDSAGNENDGDGSQPRRKRCGAVVDVAGANGGDQAEEEEHEDLAQTPVSIGERAAHVAPHGPDRGHADHDHHRAS